MSTHADGWKDEEGGVNDFKGGVQARPKHKDATFWFILEDVDDHDIQKTIERIENLLNILPGSIAVSVSAR